MSLAQDIRIAAAAYPIEGLPGWDALAAKLDHWLGEAARAGADLALLPEYAGMEAACAGEAEAETAEEWCRLAAAAAPDYAALCGELAQRHGLFLLAGSLPEETDYGLVNRARFFTPTGGSGFQDKQVLTPWEREATSLTSGAPLSPFDCDLGRIGALICYDSEFPALAAALETDLLLVPSSTEAPAGQARVQIASRARALEGQCVVAQAPLIGGVADCVVVDANTGQAGIFGPPDTGFPEDGILAAGEVDSAGWVLADLSRDALAETRATGAVAPLDHWPEAETCAGKAALRPLTHNRP
ncbi:nitrilase-related carbon-nitrogen hydrolase [Tropicimonas sp. IMCC6043]|uniref:nitrilase-related carbon-nitrogen hydrolase n=1 Tax=Tropicimonas sp. IMCC6043 TaxID=2510645 RepID=UPI00101C48D1|nr:nitrilase-related carbon-nitrogen hydrolase [Tropicimonas sp. IMCC6043]RYH08041.1 amidohydrolase [Tropicimonas sp. IMCC6043]